jgi:hypothetical protein
MNPFEKIMGAFEAYKQRAPKGMPWQGRPMEMSPQERINQSFGVPFMSPDPSPQQRIDGGFGAMFNGQAQSAMPPQMPPPAPPPMPAAVPMPQPRPAAPPMAPGPAPAEPTNPLIQLAAYFRANSAPSTATGPARSSEPVY